MKKSFMVPLTLILLIVSSLMVQAQSLTKYDFTSVVTITKSIAAGASDTTASAVISIEGDSLAFQYEAVGDSVSGSGRIQYVSVAQYTDTTTIGYYPTVVTLLNNAHAGFGTVITARTASQQWARIWMITKNNKATTQSITTRIYRVRRK